MRAPGAGAKFILPTWVPVEQLTDEEREKYQQELALKKPHQLPSTSASATVVGALVNGTKDMTTEPNVSAVILSQVRAAMDFNTPKFSTPASATQSTHAVPMAPAVNATGPTNSASAPVLVNVNEADAESSEPPLKRARIDSAAESNNSQVNLVETKLVSTNSETDPPSTTSAKAIATQAATLSAGHAPPIPVAATDVNNAATNAETVPSPPPPPQQQQEETTI